MIRAWFSALRWLAPRRRRVILAVAAALYIATMLYAPWIARGLARVLRDLVDSGVSLNRYGPIFYPPDCAVISGGFPCHYELNVSLLLVEWIFITIMTAIVWLWSKD